MIDIEATKASVAAEFRRRSRLLTGIRRHPDCIPAMMAYYRDNPASFISDWGVTIDPRLPEQGLPAMMPFSLFPRQVQLIDWILGLYSRGENGVLPKSRDIGASWVTVALACTLCLFREGLHIGFGSRKEEYVDRLGAPKALFPRARIFMQYLPPEFRRGWKPEDAPHMRINFTGTGSVITGEAGDNIGRGDRASIYFIDESAFLERPSLIEASLSATTNCRIDLSSANGMDNPFADKVFGYPENRVFTFHWRDDPRKDDDWYRKQVETLPAVVVAQEIDINFKASKEGIIIPAEWVNSAIGACEKLGIQPRGDKKMALDVADQGTDINALAGAHGIELGFLRGWSGKGDDIAGTTAWAFQHCVEFGASAFCYDADGLGVGVRGDARILNESRTGKIEATPWRAGGACVNPDEAIETLAGNIRDKGQRTNADTFKNAKAQAWHSLKLRFERTHRAVTAHAAGEPIPFDPDLLISIRPDLPGVGKLIAELSQPTWRPNSAGLLVVDKSPDGARSPNLADAVMMLYAPAKKPRKSIFT